MDKEKKFMTTGEPGLETLGMVDLSNDYLFILNSFCLKSNGVNRLKKLPHFYPFIFFIYSQARIPKGKLPAKDR